jgi:hypothetical protein
MDLGGASDPSDITLEDPQLSGNIRSSVDVGDLDTMDLPSQGTGNPLLDDPVDPNPEPSDLPPGDIEDL